MANKPAVNSEIGVPCIPLGNFAMLSCSRIPANNIKASPKPNAVEIAKTTLSSRLKSFWITIIATPRIVQLVVIRGRNTPKAW